MANQSTSSTTNSMVTDEWDRDLTQEFVFNPVALPNMADLQKRTGVAALFAALYMKVQTTSVVDMNVAFLEDAVVTCLGKLEPTGLPYTIRFDPLKPVRMVHEAAGVVMTTEETATQFPIKFFANATIVNKLVEKDLFQRFFNLLGIGFAIKTRRALEMVLSNLIVRVARRQDVLFNKPARFRLRQGFDHILPSNYTPLFRCSQTYKRFLPLIQNHCGIGVKLQLMLSSDNANVAKAKIRVLRQLVHQEQRDMIEMMSTSNAGVTLDWLNLFLQSCYVMRPKEGMAFIPSLMYYATNAEASADNFNAFYRSAISVMCNTVPYWFVELLVMTGAYYDDLGVFVAMTGISFNRKDYGTSTLAVITPRTTDIITTVLKPLKGSAGSHPGSSKQTNTIVSVHGKRRIQDDCGWMNINVMWSAHSDVFLKLKQKTEKYITDQAHGVEVCSFDTDMVGFAAIGFWND